MALKLETPKDFSATLLRRVMNGTAQVITAIDYNSLPVNLKKRYYPLARRADTTYRLYPQYINARVDIDPTRQVVTIVPLKIPNIQPRVDRILSPSLQKQILPINAQVSVSRTDLASKTKQQVVTETEATLNKRIGVTTTYSRY